MTCFFSLNATIPAGNNNAKGIIPHPLVMATAITPNTINIIPTTLTFLTTKVIGIAAMNRTNENAVPLANDENNASLAACFCC